jgi:hypothetical protein
LNKAVREAFIPMRRDREETMTASLGFTHATRHWFGAGTLSWPLVFCAVTSAGAAGLGVGIGGVGVSAGAGRSGVGVGISAGSTGAAASVGGTGVAASAHAGSAASVSAGVSTASPAASVSAGVSTPAGSAGVSASATSASVGARAPAAAIGAGVSTAGTVSAGLGAPVGGVPSAAAGLSGPGVSAGLGTAAVGVGAPTSAAAASSPGTTQISPDVPSTDTAQPVDERALQALAPEPSALYVERGPGSWRPDYRIDCTSVFCRTHLLGEVLRPARRQAAAPRSGRHYQSFDAVIRAAERGNAQAEFLVAEVLSGGHGVGANPRRAALWYGRAAEHGNGLAVSRLNQLRAALND